MMLGECYVLWQIIFLVLGLYIKLRSDCSPLEMSSVSFVSVNVENEFHELEA
jgi:hypothetical protein